MTPPITQDILKAMFADMYAADKLFWPSPFWAQLNETQIRELEQHGLEQFKRTVNMRYFNWDLKGIVAHQLWPVVKHWAQRPDLGMWRQMKLHDSARPGAGVPQLAQRAADTAYGSYLMLLKHYVEQNDPLGLLSSITEPDVGHPQVVEVDGLRVSQDLCNSVNEFYSATRGLDLSQLKASAPEIIELGAGYGRLAYVFLKALPAARYTIVDIPPALYVSQSYLSTVFPDARVFTFRPFTDFAQVKEEFEAAQIRFVAAHQIRLLPDAFAKLFVNVSSLHEMTLEQIRFYFSEVDRLTVGRFYSKQWRRSRATQNGFRIGEREYPVLPRWSPVFHERHPLQRMFFHALYDIPARKP
jgi:putative sugar O-methyltransferase